MAQTFKAGTAVLVEATFTDKDGNLYDPDANTIKLFAKKPDGTYKAGFDPNVGGGTAMTKMSVGVYQATLQLARTDPTGIWVLETQGSVGSEVSLDDAKIQVRT